MAIPHWWGYLSQGLMAVALYLVGRYRKVGWSIGMSVQLLWIGLAVLTRYWSFLAPSVITLLIYWGHLRTFRDEPFLARMRSTRELREQGGCRHCGQVPPPAGACPRCGHAAPPPTGLTTWAASHRGRSGQLARPAGRWFDGPPGTGESAKQRA